MRLKLILPLFILILYSTSTNANHIKIPHSRVCDVARDPGTLRCYNFGVVGGLVGSILDLVNKGITLKCEVATNIISAHGCLIDGILSVSKLRRVIEPLHTFLLRLPLVRWLFPGRYNPAYSELINQCLSPRYLNAPCPSLEFLHCFISTINYHCAPSVVSDYCNVVPDCAYECRHGVAYK